eukprot:9417130-Alexandrium_andersonii.AAC.1
MAVLVKCTMQCAETNARAWHVLGNATQHLRKSLAICSPARAWPSKPSQDPSPKLKAARVIQAGE